MTAKIKIDRTSQNEGGNFRSGILNGCVFPILLSGVLLILAVFLSDRIIKAAFTQYSNCNYMVVTQLKMDPTFCTGYEVKFLGATVFTIPGIKNTLDPRLEQVRSAAAWGAIFLLAFFSLFLTMILVNWRTIVGLVTFRKEEWKKFLAGLRIWLFLFVVFCLVLYFAVGK